MVVEYIRYGLTDDAQATAFERDYALAARILDDSEHCLSYQLARSVDQPLQYILRIHWDSADGHLQGFRRSAGFADFLRLVGPYTSQLLEMRHYQPTAVTGTRRGIAL